MPAKRWAGLAVVALVVVAATTFFRSWLPPENIPQQPGQPAQQATSPKQATKAPAPNGQGDLDTTLTAKAPDRENATSTASQKRASRSNEATASRQTPENEAAAESSRPMAQPGTAAPEAPETLGDPVLDGLVRDTEDRDWKVRWDAVNELGQLKDLRAVPALVDRALYDDNPHPRWRSLWALKSVDPKGLKTLPLLQTELEDGDPVVVRNAAIALAFYGSPEGRSALLDGLEDFDSYRRWEAIFSLRKIGNPEVAEALIPLLDQEKESEVRIRSEVALALGSMGGAEVIPSLLGAVSEDQSSQVRWRAAMTLGKVGDASVTEDLEQALTREEDPQVREHIEGALEKIEQRTGKSNRQLR